MALRDVGGGVYSLKRKKGLRTDRAHCGSRQHGLSRDPGFQHKKRPYEGEASTNRNDQCQPTKFFRHGESPVQHFCSNRIEFIDFKQFGAIEDTISRLKNGHEISLSPAFALLYNIGKERKAHPLALSEPVVTQLVNAISQGEQLSPKI